MKRASLKKNIVIILPMIILLILSILDMYGAKSISPLYTKNMERQLLWILIGIIVMISIYKIDERIVLKYSKHFYVIGVISLLLVLFIGKNINGATSWFRVGPFSFQPSELFKFFYIVYMSHVISNSKERDLKLFIKILLLTFLPALLIFLEPDTGVVLMYALMFFGLFIESKIPKRYMIYIISVGIASLVIFFSLYFLNGELFTKIFGTSFFYRVDRLLAFKETSSYQLNNALIGIGASGLLGFGLKSSKIYIPEVTTDFVFDLTILNFGLVIGILVVVLYVILLIGIYYKKEKSKRELDRILLSSIFYMMLFQVIEHILMNLGMLPITGITLPFLSYGGSSLLSYFMLIALVLKTKSR